MSTILSQDFFDRDPVKVCRDLLGKSLMMQNGCVVRSYMITDVEAYRGEEDEASHARHGKTARNAPMFASPGCRYVYMIYGMYHMLNIVTGPGDHPSAILIRGIREEGQDKRGKVYDGPGKLTKHLGIDKRFNSRKADKETGLWIEDDGVKIPKIQKSPRIGIDYASDERRHKHRRFFI